MIADTLDRLPHYRGIHPNLDTAIDALEKTDFNSMENGRHPIKGDEVFINVMQTKLGDGGDWEAHREYMDLQLVLANEETIAWAPLEELSHFSGYDAQRDIMQSDDPHPGSPLVLKPGSFALFFPADAHRPGIGQGEGRKAVVKIKVKLTDTPQPSPLSHQGTINLSSQRLLLRPFALEDAQAMFDNWCSDPEVAAAVEWQVHPDVGFTKRLLEDWTQSYKHPATYHWAIEMDGRLIGDIAAVSRNEKTLSAEIGYCLSRACWNQGIMTEALVRVMAFLFEEVGFRRIVLRHLVSNAASGKVMQKAGLKPEGVHRALMQNKQGRYEDVAQYAALREEWLAEHPVKT